MNTESILNNKKIILDNFNKGKFEKVIKLGKKFLKKNNDFQVLYALGVTNLTLKDYIEAEKFFRSIISLKPNAENYYIYGNIQKQLKNYNEASEYFLKLSISNLTILKLIIIWEILNLNWGLSMRRLKITKKLYNLIKKIFKHISI